MRKNTQAGFSLVELMVVVAIIGVLATVAIPRVTRFIAKSRQTEAQTNLAALHTSNKTFFNEFQGYSTDFQAMGYSPEGQLRYNVGFTGVGVGPTNYTLLKAPKTYGHETNSVDWCTANPTQCTIMNGATNAAPPAVPGSSIDASFATFTAGAIAVLITGAGGVAIDDTWTINESKTLTNTNDGTAP